MSITCPPPLVAGLVPSGWPAADADPDSSVLSTLEADPAIASQVARYERRRKVMTALMNLSTVTSPEQIRETLLACPELATDGIDAERELLSILEWPPEAARLAEARAALIRVLTPSVTDAELEAAYEAFDKERSSRYRGDSSRPDTARPAGSQNIPARPPRSGIQVAAQALHLLGLGGDERGRAGLLFHVGTHVVRRPDATQAQVAWAIQCLRDSRELWHHLGDGDRRPRPVTDLAMALHAWDYGDAYATVGEAEAVMREVVAHYERDVRRRASLRWR